MAHQANPLEACVLGEGDWIAVDELCRTYQLDLTMVVELAELGMVSPRGPAPDEWQVPATAMTRLRVAGRLMRDLGVNVSGAALAIELLDVQRELERRLRRLERLVDESG